MSGFRVYEGTENEAWRGRIVQTVSLDISIQIFLSVDLTYTMCVVL